MSRALGERPGPTQALLRGFLTLRSDGSWRRNEIVLLDRDRKPRQSLAVDRIDHPHDAPAAGDLGTRAGGCRQGEHELHGGVGLQGIRTLQQHSRRGNVLGFPLPPFRVTDGSVPDRQMKWESGSSHLIFRIYRDRTLRRGARAPQAAKLCN